MGAEAVGERCDGRRRGYVRHAVFAKVDGLQMKSTAVGARKGVDLVSGVDHPGSRTVTGLMAVTVTGESRGLAE